MAHKVCISNVFISSLIDGETSLNATSLLKIIIFFDIN